VNIVLLSELAARAELMRNVTVTGLFFVAIIASTSHANEVSTAAQLLEFQTSAKSFFSKNCLECHGADTQEGDLRFDNIGYDLSDVATSEIWARIYAQVQFSEMPPEDVDEQPSAASREKIVFLIDRELSRHGRGLNLKEKLLLPDFGNYVDHERLFDGSIEAAPYTPARLWRQRPDIYSGIWDRHYGKQHWISVKIGGTQRAGGKYVVQHGPHKGKSISIRYFADSKYANPFYEFVHHASGFSDYATISADQASLEALLINAETMAEILTLGLKVTVSTEVKSKDSRHGNNHGGFVGGLQTNHLERRGLIPVAFNKVMESKEVSRVDFDAALNVAFRLFLRRSPNKEEAEHYWVDVFQKNKELGNTMALQAVLIYVTISPEFVYRMEMGLGEKDEHGRRMLSPQEMVYSIHHAFYDTPAFGIDPVETDEVYRRESEVIIKEAMTQQQRASYAKNSWLADQMQAGKLKTRADVEVAVRRLVNDRDRNLFLNHNSPIQTVKNPRVLQFFREYFGYHKASTVFKDIEQFAKQDGFQQFHGHTPFRMMYDTDTLILHILKEDKHVLEELLTTNKAFVSYWSGTNDNAQVARVGGREKYIRTHDAQSYNVDPFENEHERNTPLLLPKEQRSGILTQPSWLVAHSGNFDNDPVRRGKWIREKLLAGSVMDVPITVDAQVPDDETKTLRERFSVVEEAECWRCHKKMNPLGMPFEAFNHVGRFRTTEKGKPVDASGAIGYTGVDELDTKVESVREMMERLAKSPRVRQSFIRHVFRYWMGRNEMLSDSKTLIAMDKAYVESDGSFNELLVSLLTSDSFLYRK
jgi:hypothetical protein